MQFICLVCGSARFVLQRDFKFPVKVKLGIKKKWIFFKGQFLTILKQKWFDLLCKSINN